MNSTIGIAARTNACNNALNSAAFLTATTASAKVIKPSNNNNTIQMKTITNSAVAATTQPINLNAGQNSKKADLAAKIIEKSDIVCFDVDSTVICEEGIDELADFCGKLSEVARVTKEAMGGAITFQDALKIRLNIIRPTQKQVGDFIQSRPSTLTHNVKAFIEKLRADGKQIYLITGGFQCLIAPVAIELGIPLTNLYANKLLFQFNGEYASFDTNQPTSKSGGKAVAISLIKKQFPNTLITMIGDGATDLEAVPPADYFIGFGGNVIRAEVQKRAQYYVTDFKQLMN